MGFVVNTAILPVSGQPLKDFRWTPHCHTRRYCNTHVGNWDWREFGALHTVAKRGCSNCV